MHVDYNKVYACFGVENFKNTPLNIFKQGGAGAGFAFESSIQSLNDSKPVINV